MIKALSATGWGKQKEILMVTYKAVIETGSWSMPLPYGRLLHRRPVLTNCKSCRMQHRTLTQGTHKTHTYNICMTITLILPIHEHIQLHASQYKQKTTTSSHPLHKHTTYLNTPRLKKHYL